MTRTREVAVGPRASSHEYLVYAASLVASSGKRRSSMDRTRDFGKSERERQAAFRDTSPTVSPEGRLPGDNKGMRNGHLLALGHEEENLYPSLRGPAGARDFFSARGIHWWRSSRSGDEAKVNGPTRNMASSQIACVNFLLPLAGTPGALASVLRSIDDDVREVVPMDYTVRGTGSPVSSPVEFEWVGRDSCLEGGPGTRGANTTSADALIVAVTETGARRAYLLEWKYVEEYEKGESLGEGKSGETRRRRYSALYAAADSRFTGKVPLDEMLFEPFYQIMRLGLLADKMVRDGKEFGVTEAKVVVVCPADNLAYRNRITSPGLEARVRAGSTVEQAVHYALRTLAGFSVACPKALVAAVRGSRHTGDLSAWLKYQHERYGL
jgi:hypothetical protein